MPVKEVGEHKRPADVPAFEENVGVLKLIETSERPRGHIIDSVLGSLTE